MENLCTDILENILFRLPVDAAIQAKRVCTTWRAILRNQTEKPGGFLFAHYVSYNNYISVFIKQLVFYEDDSKLMNYYSDNTETGNNKIITESLPTNFMVGSCNGLVCFGKFYINSPHPFLVCNPFNGESVCLPEFNYSELPGAMDRASLRKPYGLVASGFGYCPPTNDYKVVSILYCKEERQGGHVQMYTLGTGKWRYIGLTGHCCAFGYSSGIYANGALLWLQQSSNYRVQESEIVAFYLEGEKFHYMALPRSKDFEYTSYATPLKLLVGSNNLYLVHLNNGASRADIWVYKRNNRDTRTSYAMKEYDGEQNYQGRISTHWLMEISLQLDYPYYVLPFAITMINALLWYNYVRRSLYWYDPKTSNLNKLGGDYKSFKGASLSICFTRCMLSVFIIKLFQIPSDYIMLC